jgi:hypothetical protein
MTLNLITTRKEEQMNKYRAKEHKWPAKYLRRTENWTPRWYAYKKRTNLNNKQFLVDMKLPPKQFTQNERRSCNFGKEGHQGGKTRIEDEILRNCRKQNKKPDQEMD